jgi:hypothetical protein
MNVLIGSRALHFWHPELPIKDSTDWDVISPTPIEGTEWHDPKILNNKAMVDTFTTRNIIQFNEIPLYVMSMSGLAIIKRSHLWRSFKFPSHITQYHKHGLQRAFKNLDNLQVNNHGPLDFYNERLKLTHEAFPVNYPKLNKPKDEFFLDAVVRDYDHDLIHELVAYYKRPLYTRMQKTDPDTVWCDVNLWKSLSWYDKCRCVAEECMVTAIERFIIPKSNIPYRYAYMKSLDKVCTTMCSGWFRDFAIDNYPSIRELFDVQRMKTYVDKLK